MKQLLIAVGITIFVAAPANRVFAQKPAAPDFVKDVMPVLNMYCAACHNADDREGGLSVESFAELQRGGKRGPAFLPQRSSDSRLVRLLTGAAEPRMPPEDNEAPTADEIAVLRMWIDAGAPGPDGQVLERAPLVTPDLAPADGPLPITALAVSPQGDLLAVALYQKVELRATESGEVLRTLSGLPGKVNSVHFDQDGSRLVTASGVTGLYGEAALWDVAEGSVLQTFQAHRDTLYDAELSPDGALLATCSYDQRVQLWSVETGQVVRTLEGHNDAIYDLAFSPDGQVLATASGDETVKVWRTDTGERLDTMSQPQGEQYTVTFSPDGRFVVAGGADNRIRIWRLLSQDKQRINPLRHARFAHEGAIVKLAFTGDGAHLMSVAEDRTLKLWEAKQFTQIHLYETQPDQVTALASLPSAGAFLAARVDGSLARYPLVEARPVRESATVATAAETIPEISHANRIAEHEPNSTTGQAMKVFLPAQISGTLDQPGEAGADEDYFRFESKAGQQWMIEVMASQQKSPLDSRVEVLDVDGRPVERVLLRAVRDSYFTFRGKDSDTSDDFRVHNWEEMELNEFLYANGEVVKLWHYPRGPDSGFQVYPGTGKRHTFFDTTAMSHPLHEPCFIVEPYPPGSELIPNGLPVFTLYYENDDDPLRERGSDSRLLFQAPDDGEYLVRLRDTRGFEGSDYAYELTIRPRQPDFKLTIGGDNPTIEPGNGQEFSVTAQRVDGFEGEIQVQIEGLPPGFHATNPLVIQAGQQSARGTIYAQRDAAAPSAEAAKQIRLNARAVIGGQEVVREVGSLGEIKLAEKSKLLIRIVAHDSSQTPGDVSLDKPLELVVAPGETVEAKVLIDRVDFTGRVGFGTADAGRNLPHGIFVDNIGLNGLMIVEGQSERDFFITAAPWVPETTRTFHLRASDVDGNPTSWPVILHVRRADAVATN